LVTKDEIPNPNALKIKTVLNGQTMQDWTTEDMIFDVRTLIVFLSGSTTLLPGTVIMTGTPHASASIAGRCAGLKLVPASPEMEWAGKRLAADARASPLTVIFISRPGTFRHLACGRGYMSRESGSGEPMRPPGSSMVVQVPPSTNFQALPW
jgi:hypothetical protein